MRPSLRLSLVVVVVASYAAASIVQEAAGEVTYDAVARVDAGGGWSLPVSATVRSSDGSRSVEVDPPPGGRPFGVTIVDDAGSERTLMRSIDARLGTRIRCVTADAPTILQELRPGASGRQVWRSDHCGGEVRWRVGSVAQIHDGVDMVDAWPVWRTTEVYAAGDVVLGELLWLTAGGDAPLRWDGSLLAAGSRLEWVARRGRRTHAARLSL